MSEQQTMDLEKEIKAILEGMDDDDLKGLDFYIFCFILDEYDQNKIK